MVRYAILGPVGLCDGERRTVVGGPRQVALLALLLLNANRAVSSDELIDALWGDLGPQGAVKRLQVSIARLRRTLDTDAAREEPVLRTVAGGYLLEVRPGEVDAEAFASLAEQGRRALHDGDPHHARSILCEALALWQGPALADVAFEEFALTEIRRLEELRLAALELRVQADLQLGQHGGLIGELESLVTAHPGRERFAAQLMLALYRCGRQGEALEVYARSHAHLSHELGLKPGPELRALQRSILDQDPALDLDLPAGASMAPGAPQMRQPIPLPAALTASARDEFVARGADLDRLTNAFAAAAAGERQLVLLSGEPGIGKTRLASEFALRAHDDGAIVLYGRCDEEGMLVQQPFVEALRHYAWACPPHDLAAQLGRSGGELRRVVPELADRVAGLPEPLAGDPEGARSRMWEAGCSLLSAASRKSPVVLVLDDLHWADKAALLLLRYIVRHPRQARLLVLATYRDTELDDEHPLCSALAELRREPNTEHLALAPLDAAAVSELVGVHAANASAELRRVIYDETEGNAFFVVELLRHLAESGATGLERERPRDAAGGAFDVPEGVRAVVTQRLARLGRNANRLLTTAAVVGRSFELGVLQRLSDLSEDELLDALDAAVRARVIEEVAGVGGQYAFAHALIRDTLYDGLTATRRALLHRRVACAIEQASAGRLEPRLAELAHHFAQAGSDDDLAKAIEYGARAGDYAISQLAYEQGAAHLRRAVELVATSASPDSQTRRCDLLIAQGEAERQAGDPAYRRTLLAAAALAQELGEPDRLARAALANSRGYSSSAEGVDRDRVAVLRAALDAREGTDSPTRAALLALLAVELVNDPNWRLRDELTDEALAMARRVGHPGTLARVLTQCCVARWRAQTASEIQADLQDAEQLADRLKEPQLAGLATYLGAHAAMENGDVVEADRLVTRVTAIAEQLGQPFMSWYAAVARAKRAAIGGPPDDAERLAFVALEHGRDTSQPDIMLWFLGQLLVARFLQGSLDRGDPFLPDLFTAGSSLPVSADVIPSRSMPLLVGAAASLLLCEVGRLDAARTYYDPLMSELDELPHDYTALAIPAFASIACGHLDDADGAARLHALLEPHAHRLVNTGSSWFGAVSHHLGNLATTMGQIDTAEARFDAAAGVYEVLDAQPWLARLRSDRRR